MKRSPLFFLILVTLFFLLLSSILSISRPYLLNHLIRLVNPQHRQQIEELALANYYLHTGRSENAAEEYQNLYSTLPESERASAIKDLIRIISLLESTDGQIFLGLIYVSWFLPPKLIILSIITLTLSIIIFAIQKFGKSPTFVILPFQDSSGILKDINLPEYAQDHLQEIVWRTEKLNETSSIFFENIEVPVLGLVGDYSHIDSVSLIETALSYSLGISDLPVSRLYNSTRIWLEQPKYLVRGYIEANNDKLGITVILSKTKDNSIEKVWRSEIPGEQHNTTSDILDLIVFPILFFFTPRPNTKRWEALRALHNGIKEYQLFQNHIAEVDHLDKAIQHVRLALQIDHEYDVAAYNLGLFLMAVGDYQNARGYLQR